MSAPIDRGLRERQLSRGFMYPRAMPVRKGDRVMIVRGEGKSKSATRIAKIDRKGRKVYVEGFTYFKSDGTELQRPIDASNLVIINPDWSDIRRRNLLTRVNESVEWTDEVISDFEAAEDEYEAETVGPIEEETETTDVDYDSMTVPNLKAALKEQGLPVSGKKTELIERLKENSKDEYKAETVDPIGEEKADEETSEEEDEYEAETVGPIEEETETTDVDYDSMTISDLKAALKEQGLPVSGKKTELIERLKEDSKDKSKAETIDPIEEEKADKETSEEETESKETKTTDVDYDSMTVPNLKAALKEQGLPVSGKKTELIERLKGDSK